MSLKINNFDNWAYNYIAQIQESLDQVDLAQVEKAVELIQACKGTVWLIGNGGSASLASHMATDLQLAGVRAIALTDVAALTTYGNDKSYQDTFSSQLEVLSTKADVLIAITGSGRSANINQAVSRFHGKTIAITGFSGGVLGTFANMRGSKVLHINVPSNHMGVSQDGHQVVLHIICYYLMQEREQ